MKGVLLAATAISFLLAATIAHAAGDDPIVYAQRDMMSLIQDGKAKITADKTDIGRLEELFDGDYKTLIRSNNINPFTVTLILTKPLDFDRVSIRTNDEEYQWTMEIADSENDLSKQRSSYRKIVDNRRYRGELDEMLFETELKARAFRLTAQRLTGDDYVHI